LTSGFYEYTIRAVSNFFENSQRYSQLKEFSTSVVDIGGKFATGVVDTNGAPSLANISANVKKKSK
jgi:hypothetical protein